jgi:hypothetical protein
MVALGGEDAGALLETIAALLEAVRATARAPYHRDWWARHRGAAEARLRICWALSEGEAARARMLGRTAFSEWRLGPLDGLPREIPVEGALSRHARADLARYAHLDANRSTVWVGGPAADPLAEALARSAARDVAATRVRCRLGVGPIAWETPDSLAALSRAVAPVLPALRLARIACPRGGMPVACYRGEQRVELGELADVERDALHVVAALHAANVRDGVVLIDSPELHVPRAEHACWLTWLAGLTVGNQLFVAPSQGRRGAALGTAPNEQCRPEGSPGIAVDEVRPSAATVTHKGPERAGMTIHAGSTPGRKIETKDNDA